MAGALILVFLFASRLQAQTPATNVDSFEAAFETISNGGGTILVTQPIVIDSSADFNSFDGQSNAVLVSGGSTNPIFIVTNGGTLFLADMTLANGLSTNSGGAIFVTSDSMLTVSNCVFSNNVVIGASGLSAATNSPTNSPVIGGNGRSGTSGRSVSGGAIFNLGALTVLNCQFLTNSAIGGNGGNGGPGVDGTTSGGNGGRGGNGGGAVGGGIYDAGQSLFIANSTFSANLAQAGSAGAGGAGGGGIVSGQAAGGGTGGDAAGAGLFTRNTNGGAVIWASTFANNSAQGGNSADGGITAGGNGQDGRNGGDALGGGIDNVGLLNITNSTFFQNIASGGAGGNGGSGAGGGNGGNGGSATGGSLYNAGTVFVLNCTFSMGGAIGGTNGFGGSGIANGNNGGKGARRGGNIANLARKKKGSFTIANSIIGKTTAGPGSFGTISDGGFNISADKSIPFKSIKKGGTSLAKTDPKLGDLAANGGPTETIALPTNSLAIDFINPNLAKNGATLDVDQRGTGRPIQVFSNDWNDAGAFELDPNAVTIIKQPQSTNVPAGSNVTFSVTAQSILPLSYQWYFNPSNLPPSALADSNNILSGATSNVLSITGAQSTDQGFYIVVINNAFDSATSKVASLTIIAPPAITAFTVNPTNGAVPLGSNATISVTASGASPLTYQWSFFAQTNSATNTLSNGGNVSGATSNILSITNFQPANDGNYFVIVANSAGSATSLVASLTTTIPSNSPPIITSSNLTPANGAVLQFSNATINVTVVSPSNAPVGYQWFFVQTNTTTTNTLTDNPANFPGNIIGSTSNLLTITNFDFQVPQNEGIYFVVVTNAFGSTTSRVFTLTLNTGGGGPPPPVAFLDKSLRPPSQPSLALSEVRQNGTAPLSPLQFSPALVVNRVRPSKRPNWTRSALDRSVLGIRFRTSEHSPPAAT